MHNHRGFTLLELTISMAILTVVSLLTFLVTNSSTKAAAIAEGKEGVHAAVRDAMNTLASELQLAAKTTNNALTPPLAAVQVNGTDPGEVTFQIPDDSFGLRWSTPITYRFVNEDAGEGLGAGNARLDEGEDLDGDGALTRHIVRVQDGEERVLGLTNDLSDVQFSLSPNSDVLTITLSASKVVNTRRQDLVRATATSRVYLLN
ncbi:MAG: prepilin-type N-terminal cleavage/methylation domain-containing protein [Nitrospiraceae bacterium]|nr:prepilin-type N-terminal cleavage/methylation domain-containing protein [Nitrospiraceae bacterium]